MTTKLDRSVRKAFATIGHGMTERRNKQKKGQIPPDRGLAPPKRHPTTKEEVLSKMVKDSETWNLTPADLDSIKAELEARATQREEHRKQLQRDFAAKQAAEMLPESYIPRMWNVRFAYPQKLREIENAYSLKDLKRVRDLCLQGRLNHHIPHPDNMSAFLSWIGAVIEKKKAS